MQSNLNNPKKPFKIICTNCGRERLIEHQAEINFFEEHDVDVYGVAFYDSATVTLDCKCGNEIEK